MLHWQFSPPAPLTRDTGNRGREYQRGKQSVTLCRLHDPCNRSYQHTYQHSDLHTHKYTNEHSYQYAQQYPNVYSYRHTHEHTHEHTHAIADRGPCDHSGQASPAQRAAKRAGKLHTAPRQWRARFQLLNKYRQQWLLYGNSARGGYLRLGGEEPSNAGQRGRCLSSERHDQPGNGHCWQKGTPATMTASLP